MARRYIAFTDRELDIMAVLWATESGTVAEVQEGIEAPLAYTTVLTILRTLEEKGYVRHSAQGRAHRYHPLVSWEEAQDAHLGRLLGKLFQDSPALLLTRLLRLPGVSTKDRRALGKVLASRKR